MAAGNARRSAAVAVRDRRGTEWVLTGEHPSTFDAYVAFTRPARDRAFGPYGLHHPIGNIVEMVEDFVPVPAEGGLQLGSLLRFAVGTPWFAQTENIELDSLTSIAFLPAPGSSDDWGFRCAKSISQE